MIRIAVVGRGVIGLSCGVLLARAGQSVTLVSRPRSAAEVITSEVAAAFWFPYLTAVESTSGFTEADLAQPTLEHFHTLLADRDAHIRLVQGVEYVGAPAGQNGLLPRWWHNLSEVGFCPLGSGELPDIPEFGVLQAGCTFVVPVVFMPGYLAYLARDFQRAGGQERSLEIGSLDHLEEFDVVVNCAGLDARSLAADNSLTAVRGQVVVVSDVPYPHDRLYFIDQGDAFTREPVYIVPRGRDVVLGGTAEVLPAEQASLRSPEASRGCDEVSARIIRRCALLRPEFAATRTYQAKVGARPCRPTVRIEWDGRNFRRPVVHCYGHGGAGVTLSWGSAQAVRQLIGRHLQSPAGQSGQSG